MTTLVQGGQPPMYFAGAVADFLVLDRVRSPDDITAYEVRQCLQKVCVCVYVCMCVCMCMCTHAYVYFVQFS